MTQQAMYLLLEWASKQDKKIQKEFAIFYENYVSDYSTPPTAEDIKRMIALFVKNL
jgi:hypothetical protein